MQRNVDLNQSLKHKVNGMVIIGFVLAFLFPLAGLIVSMNGLGVVNRTNEPGRRLAIAGIVVSTVMILLSFLLIPLILRTADQMHLESRDRTRQTNVDLLQSELSDYYQTNDHYPSSLEAVQEQFPAYLFDHPDFNLEYDYQAIPEGCQECSGYTLGIDLESGSAYGVQSPEQ